MKFPGEGDGKPRLAFESEPPTTWRSFADCPGDGSPNSSHTFFVDLAYRPKTIHCGQHDYDAPVDPSRALSLQGSGEH